MVEIHAKLSAGEITWQTRAAPMGSSDWLPLLHTPGLGPPTLDQPSTPPPVRAESSPNRVMSDADKLQQIVYWQRWALRAALIYAAILVGCFLLIGESGGLYLALGCLLVVPATQLARALGLAPLPRAFGAFIPLIGVFVVSDLVKAATRRFEDAGIKTSFYGVPLSTPAPPQSQADASGRRRD